ncbi:MAG: response regulator transcription factor [Algiphilus sp.]|uniref:response regulator transcription factor n=1 Tax=Algiphilus sp. TaxID=1872431 RepID=UPI0032EF1E99
MRLLIIEDETALLEQLASLLEKEGFTVERAANGEDGGWMACEFALDLAIIDIGLPDVSGVDVIRKLRGEGKAYPVLILTARDGWRAKVEALEAGADDYVVKPFHEEELLARVRALLRRASGWASAAISSGPFTLDTRAKSLERDGDAIELTAYEYKVLEYLLMHAGEVISKTRLSEHIYDEETERDSNVIEVFVRRLRAKLDPEETLNPIDTLRGQGYRWSLPRG